MTARALCEVRHVRPLWAGSGLFVGPSPDLMSREAYPVDIATVDGPTAPVAHLKALRIYGGSWWGEAHGTLDGCPEVGTVDPTVAARCAVFLDMMGEPDEAGALWPDVYRDGDA